MLLWDETLRPENEKTILNKVKVLMFREIDIGALGNRYT